MIQSKRIFSSPIIATCVFCACAANAGQNAPSVMSKYGEIQSVNKYSSNPFWSPNSPYNQRIPTPIYATGPDLNTGDCNRIVQNLISSYCESRDYCSNLRISDVRPTIMVQLSQLPGHNFATSCGGYIDSIFENYKKTYGNTSTVNVVKPAAQKSIQIENPFTQKQSEFDTTVEDRTAELERLQRVTTPTAGVTAAAFPKTVSDLSFTDRMANTNAGYEPYKDLNAYKTPQFETEDEYYKRMKSALKHDTHPVGANTANESTNPNGPANPVGPVEPVTPQNAPQCLKDIANDANFQSTMSTKLAGASDLTKWVTNNKSAFYGLAADAVVKHCIKNSANLNEFNIFLDDATTIPIFVNFNNSQHTVSVDKLELFDYTDYWTYPIVILNNGIQNIGTTLQESSASLPAQKRQCTGPFVTSLGVNFSGAETAIEAGARPVYPRPSGSGMGYAIGKASFPGMLYNYHQTFSNYTGVHLIKTKNYALARDQIKKFVTGINSDGGCVGNNMVVYLVSEPSPSENKAKSVRIVSEPFIIR